MIMCSFYFCGFFFAPVLLATDSHHSDSYVLSPGYCPIDTANLTDEFTFEFDLEMFTWSGSFIHIFDIIGGSALRYDGSKDTLYLTTWWPETTHALNRPFKSPDDDNINVHHEIILTQSTIQWKMDNVLIVNATKGKHKIGSVGPICFPSTGNGYATASENKGKISNFQIIQTTTTNRPIATSTIVAVFDHIVGKMCNNLFENVYIGYGGGFDECVRICDGFDTCKMLNYFEYFKSNNDSRCYIFDDMCTVIEDGNSNRSVISYNTFNSECSDYPHDWTDNADDKCDHYDTYNFCYDGDILKNVEEFDNFMDTVYGLTAIETCCDCGGGVIIMDDVVMSADKSWFDLHDDILCKWVESDFTSQYRNNSLRTWDNLVLYNFCKSLKGVDCNYLIDTQFIATDYTYNIILCDMKQNDEELEMIFDIVIDDIKELYTTYIHKKWFIIDTTYYSSNINVHHLSYTHCIQNITVGVFNVSDVYRYGIHPCYIKSEVISSTIMSSQDQTSVYLLDITTTNNPKNKNDRWIVVVIIIVISVLMVFIAVMIYRRCNVAKEVDDYSTKQIEMNGNVNPTTNMSPSAPEIEELEDDGKMDEANYSAGYCILCCDNQANIFNDPCGHITYCSRCVKAVDSNKCPTCRAHVQQFKKMYPSGFND